MQNKTTTITKRDCDEWVDGEGKFHRKVTFETITDPINTKQATQQIIRVPLPRFFKKLNTKVLEPPKFSHPSMIDIGKMMKMGKEFLDNCGIDIKDVFEGVAKDMNLEHSVPVEETSGVIQPTEKPSKKQKEVKNKTWQKTKKTKIKKQNQKKKKQTK